MNRGDTVNLILDYTFDGEPLEKDAYDEIEFQLNAQGADSVKLLLSDGRIVWDDSLGKYTAKLSQKDTFKLDEEVEVQIRILLADDVYSSDITAFNLGEVLSRKVLTDGE